MSTQKLGVVGLDRDVSAELGTCLGAKCGLRRSARSESTESILKVVSALSGCSSPSMIMTALWAFNHWSFKESPSRIASRTRSARWVVDKSIAEASTSSWEWAWAALCSCADFVLRLAVVVRGRVGCNMLWYSWVIGLKDSWQLSWKWKTGRRSSQSERYFFPIEDSIRTKPHVYES